MAAFNLSDGFTDQHVVSGSNVSAPKSVWTGLVALSLGLVLDSRAGFGNETQGVAPASAIPTAQRAGQRAGERDGQHDFDFEIGTWKTRLRRLLHPLTGSTTWVEYVGTTTVRKVWNGRANLVELTVSGPAGHIEALSLRLYNPEAHQWSLNFSNSAAGAMTTPSVGEFKNGRGEFIDQETLGARAILVRFVISDIKPNSCHFEQAFSEDGGKSWEVNWIADDTRASGVAGAAGT